MTLDAMDIFERTGTCPVPQPTWCNGCDEHHDDLSRMWVHTYETGYWCIHCDGHHELSFCCDRHHTA
jgi:hypothetical protein